ncbi:unnamed protein product [Strongylus vulgaris]|uniref:Uncharacterized protein n=1 Tax=Strongylus vulgaris TaxID=40348 RepID=A0A3P7JH26_STRVU|nr:unnamed protein product [Strongylus vulgaris]
MDDARCSSEENENPNHNLGFTPYRVPIERHGLERSSGMFVSAWQDDDQGIREANLEYPSERFLKEAENGNVDVLKSIISHSVNLPKGWTPLHSAANWGNYEVIGRLITYGVDANARSAGNVTVTLLYIFLTSSRPLHLAISSQCDNSENVLHCVRYLLQAPGE